MNEWVTGQNPLLSVVIRAASYFTTAQHSILCFQFWVTNKGCWCYCRIQHTVLSIYCRFSICLKQLMKNKTARGEQGNELFSRCMTSWPRRAPACGCTPPMTGTPWTWACPRRHLPQLPAPRRGPCTTHLDPPILVACPQTACWLAVQGDTERTFSSSPRCAVHGAPSSSPAFRP